jgi:hypothetical protein
LQVAIGGGGILLDKTSPGLEDDRLGDQRDPEVVAFMDRWRKLAVEVVEDDSVLSGFY